MRRQIQHDGATVTAFVGDDLVGEFHRLAIGVLGFLTVWVPHRQSDAICAPGTGVTLTQIKTSP
ncbi:MAG: hypothetical protein HC788_07440 [Sphingopyxis sp.]|nr:hypothetical protein [Sphingopyxis sp.]